MRAHGLTAVMRLGKNTPSAAATRPGMKGTLHGGAAFCGPLLIIIATKAAAADYSTYTNWADMVRATEAKYATAHRISGTNGFTGFWFFGAEQFDDSNRYALAMTVYFKDREVTKDDVGDIGYFDLQNGDKWTSDRYDHRLELATGLSLAMAPQIGGDRLERPRERQLPFHYQALQLQD